MLFASQILQDLLPALHPDLSKRASEASKPLEVGNWSIKYLLVKTVNRTFQGDIVGICGRLHVQAQKLPSVAVVCLLEDELRCN